MLAHAPKGGPRAYYTAIVLNLVGEALIDLYDLVEALATYSTALRLTERLVNSDHRNPHYLGVLAQTQSGKGDVHAERGEGPEALTFIRGRARHIERGY